MSTDSSIEERLERLEARCKLLSTRLRRQQQQSKERRQWQSALFLLPILGVVLLASGFSVKGRSGDAEYSIGLKISDVVQVIGAIAAAGAGWQAFAAKADDGPDDDQADS
jgi:hypothetical protein